MKIVRVREPLNPGAETAAMAPKKSGLIKNVVLLLVVVACGVGVWYVLTQRAGAADEQDVQMWFESGEMVQEQLDLEGVKAKLDHDSPQDMGEGRYRFDMSVVEPGNTLVVDVVIRGGRAISYTIVTPAS